MSTAILFSVTLPFILTYSATYATEEWSHLVASLGYKNEHGEYEKTCSGVLVNLDDGDFKGKLVLTTRDCAQEVKANKEHAARFPGLGTTEFTIDEVFVFKKDPNGNTLGLVLLKESIGRNGFDLPPPNPAVLHLTHPRAVQWLDDKGLTVPNANLAIPSSQIDNSNHYLRVTNDELGRPTDHKTFRGSPLFVQRFSNVLLGLYSHKVDNENEKDTSTRFYINVKAKLVTIAMGIAKLKMKSHEKQGVLAGETTSPRSYGKWSSFNH